MKQPSRNTPYTTIWQESKKGIGKKAVMSILVNIRIMQAVVFQMDFEVVG